MVSRGYVLFLALSFSAVYANAPVSKGDDDLVMGIMSGHCYEDLFMNLNINNTACISALISKLLGFAIIAGAFLLKVPQIFVIVKAGDVTGISFASFALEVLTFTAGVAYNTLSGHPLISYGEQIVILIQNILLVLIWCWYSVPATSSSFVILISVVYGAIVFGIASLPAEFHFYLSVVGIPASILARLPQIISNLKMGHTGRLSLISLALNLAGSCARVFTTLQEVGLDMGLIAGLGVSVVLNGMLVFQVLWYYNATKIALEGKKKD